MKTELNTKLVAILCTAMATGLGAIVKGENALIDSLIKAWSDFLASKDGTEEHWTYFDEEGFPKRHGVLEFREAVKAAAERGGYCPKYVCSFLRSVDVCFELRKSAPKTGRKVTVKFSDAQLAEIEKVALNCSMTRDSIKALIATLRK
jgi:hypothetical protein